MTIESVAFIAENLTRWLGAKEPRHDLHECDRKEPLFGIRTLADEGYITCR